VTEEFQAEAAMNVSEVVDLYVPRRIGVGVLQRLGNNAEHPGILGMELEGAFVEAPDERISLVVALDTERSVGLIVQLREMLLDAGVSPGQIVAMMKQAYSRMDAVRAQDRAPFFRCPRCYAVSHNAYDIAKRYCGNCHTFTDDRGDLT